MAEQIPTLEDPFDYSDEVATTKWVQNHRWSSNIDRWEVVFDCRYEKMDWGYGEGIKGGRVLKPLKIDSIYEQGERIRFFLSYNEMNPVCVTGEFYDNRRIIYGTTFYDGKTVTSVSIDLDFKNGSIVVYGYDLTNCKDVSKLCNLIKIQITW